MVLSKKKKEWWTGGVSDLQAFINSLTASGVLAKQDLLCVYARDTLANGLLDITDNGFDSAVFNDPVFTPNRGLKGDASAAYIDLNYNPAGDKINWSKNDCCIWVYRITARTGNANAGHFWDNTPTERSLMFTSLTAGTISFIGLEIQSLVSFAGDADSIGLWLGNRTASGETQGYIENVEVIDQTGVANTASEPNDDGVLLAMTDNGVRSFFNNDELAMVGVASGFTAQNRTDLQSAVDAYLTAIGAI